ncbi:ferrochelatase [Candidatus Enterovibrio escicola]|nr:ferrochelatase [Candidatus Enterovibrio escacola]
MDKKEQKIGVLLANLGTPDAPTVKAVKSFLNDFLYDPRVVDMIRWLWYPLLHGIILPVRAPRIAKLYQNIWMEEGSPLMVHSCRQQLALEEATNLPIAIGMTYGQPSLTSALDELKSRGCNKILIFPLYPQYSGMTTAAVFDKIAQIVKLHPVLPEFRFINHYHDEALYAKALMISVREHWDRNGKPDMLVCSYHGIPENFVDNGDPYRTHCLSTTDKLVACLGDIIPLKTTFQSRFGRKKWLQPYTNKTLEQLPNDGIKKIDVISPSFSVDCLETLEEISEQYRELFLGAGGEEFNYIPCLNDGLAHIEMMKQLVIRHVHNW